MTPEFETPVFDVKDLTEYELGHLEYILNSPSYERVFRPFLLRQREQFIAAWMDPRVNMKKIPDEDLRAGARMAENMVEFFDKIIKETQHERAMRARESLGQEDLHREAVAQGLIRPGGQTAPPKDDYPDDVEF